jgi:selT/selW/selH-like putative selenoprotein
VINERTAHKAEATPGHTGQFDIFVDDEIVFSKREAGRFPEEDEVLDLVGTQ